MDRGCLDELDLVAGLEGHDRLLVVGRHARLALAALLVLAADIHDVHALHGHLEGVLDRLGDRVLRGAGENLKGVLAQRGAELVRLLGEVNQFQNVVGIHQFVPPLTRAMMASSALMLTMIFTYCARSLVLSLAASCSVTRPRLRDARAASAVNGASTSSTLPLGAMSVTTLFMTLVFTGAATNESMTASSPAETRSNSARLKARAFTFALIFLE